jgi:hypothetical protein
MGGNRENFAPESVNIDYFDTSPQKDQLLLGDTRMLAVALRGDTLLRSPWQKCEYFHTFWLWKIKSKS